MERMAFENRRGRCARRRPASVQRPGATVGRCLGPALSPVRGGEAARRDRWLIEVGRVNRCWRRTNDRPRLIAGIPHGSPEPLVPGRSTGDRPRQIQREICPFFVSSRGSSGRLVGTLGAVPMSFSALSAGEVAQIFHARRAKDADGNDSRQVDYDSCGGRFPDAGGRGRQRLAEPANAQPACITGVTSRFGRSDPFSGSPTTSEIGDSLSIST
jgi:hypothetical protein